MIRRPIALGFSVARVAFPVNAVCFNEEKSINWTINGFKSHWKPPIAVPFEAENKNAKWNEQSCTLLLWKMYGYTLHVCRKKRSVNSQQNHMENAKIKQNKTKTASRNCQIYDITRIHDRHNSGNSNNEQPATTNHHAILTQCVLMAVFTQFFPAYSSKERMINVYAYMRKEREY